MHSQDEDNDDERRSPLRGHENAEVRDVLEERRRVRWLRSLVLKCMGAAVASAAGWQAIRYVASDVLKALNMWKG